MTRPKFIVGFTFLTTLLFVAVLLILFTSPGSDESDEIVDEIVTGSGLIYSSCVPTSSLVVVGHQESKTILATSSTRAWARIQQPVNATNTLALDLTGGVATLNSSAQLTPATTSSPVPFIDLGRNTELPHAGLISGITDKGTTTVHVTECNYQ